MIDKKEPEKSLDSNHKKLPDNIGRKKKKNKIK